MLIFQEINPGLGWAGRVDGYFLPELPINLMKKRKPYNLMIGVTKDEYAQFCQSYVWFLIINFLLLSES